MLVLAQASAGYAKRSDAVPAAPAMAEQAMSEFAQCLLKSKARRLEVETFVRIHPGDPAFGRTGAELATRDCVPRDYRGATVMRFPPELLRAALFSAIYQREFGAKPPSELASSPETMVASEFVGDASSGPDTLYLMRELGDCTARAEPLGAHALLVTKVRGKAESPALNAVMPALAKCLSKQRQIRFSRTMLRGMLAEAMVKLRRGADARAPISIVRTSS